MHLWSATFSISLLIALAPAAFAEEPICFAAPVGDPNPQIESITKDPRCFVEDDFARSCAYRDFVRKENEAAARIQARNWAARFASVFDPAAKFGEKESLFGDIQAAATNPRFLDFLDFWEALGRPAGGNGVRYHSALSKNFGDADLEKFYRALRGIGLLDRTGTFMAALEMLSVLPDDAGKKASLSERRSLLENLFKQGLDFKNAHSAGCRAFAAKTSKIGNGETKFGPVYQSGDAARKNGDEDGFAAKRDQAIAASERSVAGSRTIAGAMTPLPGPTTEFRACGNAGADVRYTVAEIIQSCDVDLPVAVFQDNRADLPQAKRDVLLAAIAKNECYKKSIAAGLKIQRVAIATSANTLHNTENYCMRGFKRLSEDRARTIQDAMTGYFGDAAIRYEPDSRGSNGDGSSGPCAYVAKEVAAASPSTYDVTVEDGATKKVRHFVETRDPKYASAAGEKSLEPFKYAKTTIYFEDRKNPVASTDRQWSAITQCKTVRFQCE